jgi:hypothetical protein
MIEELLNFKKLKERKTYALGRAQNALFFANFDTQSNC